MARGNPKGVGRPVGAKNKTQPEIKSIAAQYGEDAIKCLVGIMHKGESDAVKISAAKELLDRGYGKPKQAVDLQANIDTLTEIKWIIG